MNELIKCTYCEAQYTPRDDWVYGRYSDDTTTDFTTLGRRKKNECPVCGKPNREKRMETAT